MPPIVAVTGATGNVGQALARQLLHNGIAVRAIARNRTKLSALAAKGAQECSGDLQDVDFLAEAFHGADAVFAMIPEHPIVPDFLADKRRTAASLAGALKTARVPRVVALSAIGVDPPTGIGPSAANGEFEEMLKSIPGLSVVALRAAFLMENLLGATPIIKSAGINGGPLRPDVSLAMISTRDIASVAAEYLTARTFNGYTVRQLLGPRDHTCLDATSILGAAIGKPGLGYAQFPYEEFRKGLLGAGFSPTAAATVVELFTAINEGRVQQLAMRTAMSTTPTTLEEFARDVFAPAYRAG